MGNNEDKHSKATQRLERYTEDRGQWLPLETWSGTAWPLCRKVQLFLSTGAVSITDVGKYLMLPMVLHSDSLGPQSYKA